MGNKTFYGDGPAQLPNLLFSRLDTSSQVVGCRVLRVVFMSTFVTSRAGENQMKSTEFTKSNGCLKKFGLKRWKIIEGNLKASARTV